MSFIALNMRLCSKRSISFIIFFLVIFSMLSTITHAQGGYVVRPHTNNTSELIDSSGFDATITFWDLPLQIKILYFLAISIAILGTLRIFPIILGKIKNILENNKRKNIYRYIISNAGCTLPEICKKHDMSKGNVKFHLRMLESHGKIIIQKVGRFLRVYPSKIYRNKEKVMITYLRDDTDGPLLKSINTNPGITNSELAYKLKLKRSTIHWHIERFIKDGIIRYENDGIYKRYYIKEDIKEMLSR